MKNRIYVNLENAGNVFKSSTRAGNCAGFQAFGVGVHGKLSSYPDVHGTIKL
jgi:hypothetical protein